MRISRIVLIAALKSHIKAKLSHDPALVAAESSVDQTEDCLKIARQLRIPWPSTLEQLELEKIKLKRKEVDAWKRLSCQGHGISDFCGDKLANIWIYNHNYLKDSRFIDALKLRSNTAGTRMALRRANAGISEMCRRCSTLRETLAHVLGQCTATKALRIKRHNELVEFISKVAKRKYPEIKIFPEPAVKVHNNLYKPDIIIIKENKVLVVDVTVRYENGDSLEMARIEKIEKYKGVAAKVQWDTHSTGNSVIPIVIGSRGALPMSTKNNLKDLGFNKSDIITASMIALRTSIEIFNQFLDYDNT